VSSLTGLACLSLDYPVLTPTIASLSRIPSGLPTTRPVAADSKVEGQTSDLFKRNERA
jgi:hypothetical protein